MRITNVYGQYLLVFLFFGTTATATEQYYIGTYNVSAGDAANSCTLASPPIVYNRGNITIDMNTADILDAQHMLKDGQNISIGYVEQFVTFLYKGCSVPGNIDSINFTNATMDPGQCFSRCGTDAIGLQETTCHCLTTLPRDNQVLLKDGCNARCTNPTGVLCGSHNLMSVYQKIENITHNSIDGACLSFNPAGRVLKWDLCSANTLSVICRQDDNAVTTCTDCLFKHWDEAMLVCLKNHSYPLNPLRDNLTHGGDFLLWTGAIRSRGIFPSKDEHTTADGKKLGYVEFSDGTFYLKFRPASDAVKLDSLCVKKEPTTSTTTTSTSFHNDLHTTTVTIADNIKHQSTVVTTKSRTIHSRAATTPAAVLSSRPSFQTDYRTTTVVTTTRTSTSMMSNKAHTTQNPSFPPLSSTSSLTTGLLTMVATSTYENNTSLGANTTSAAFSVSTSSTTSSHTSHKTMGESTTTATEQSKRFQIKKIILYAAPAVLLLLVGVVVIILWRRGIICKRKDGDIDTAVATVTSKKKSGDDDYEEIPLGKHDRITIGSLGEHVNVDEVNEPDAKVGDYDTTMRYPKKQDTNESKYDRVFGIQNKPDPDKVDYAKVVKLSKGKDVGDNNYETAQKQESSEGDYHTTTKTFSKPGKNETSSSNTYDRLANADRFNRDWDLQNMSSKIDDTYNHL